MHRNEKYNKGVIWEDVLLEQKYQNPNPSVSSNNIDIKEYKK